MKIQLFIDNKLQGKSFGKDFENITLSSIDDKPLPDIDLIIFSVNIIENERSRRLGLSFLQKIRRDYFVKIPIIVYSFESFEELVIDYPILQTKGVSFLQLPFTSTILNNQVIKFQNEILTESELIEIVKLCCNLKEKWSKTSHKIGGYLTNYSENKSQIENLVNEWTKSINLYAPEQTANLEKLRTLLDLPPKSVDIDELNSVNQKLDEGLQGIKPQQTYTDISKLPNRPPKGFSKILIADDEPLDSLISNLQTEYNYEIVGQPKGSKEAKRQVREKLPTVILSDFYFKQLESDKTTDKRFGIEFMEFAESFDVGSKDKPKKPIVAVISKTRLDSDEITAGVLDCSGSRNATNAQFIHSKIWDEAILNRGVTEAEIIAGQEWKPEHLCRQRLEPYKNNLLTLITQCDTFKETVRETLAMTQSIKKSVDTAEFEIIDKIISILKPYKNNKDFSFEDVNNIFPEIEKSHNVAKQPPKSEIKKTIRNILHGVTKQFSYVSNQIETARNIFDEVSSELISLPKFNKIGVRLKETLGKFGEKKPLIPFLTLLQKDVDWAVKELPEPAKLEVISKARGSVKRKINIIVVEDNKVWSEIVLSAVEKTKSKLGENSVIEFKPFNNAKEVLEDISQIVAKWQKEPDYDEVITIAIVDICLPADNEKPHQIPDMKNGIEILKLLSEYTVNIPIIVFSTKSSLEDIRSIGKFGISDENFISKEESDPEPTIVQSIINLVEKKQKFPVCQFSKERNDEIFYEFSIDGLPVPFSNELKTLFQALFELREDGDIENKTQFTPEEIYTRKLKISGEYEYEFKFSENNKHSVQDQINDIRKFVYKTFQKNNRYINIRNLIKTNIKEYPEESCYELNAELSFFDYDEERENSKDQKYNVLVIEKDKELRNRIVKALERVADTVKIYDSTDEDLSEIVNAFRPDIVCVNLQQIEYWQSIKSVTANKRLGVIVLTTNDEPNKKSLIGTALKSGIPNTNFVSMNKEDWINSFLTKLDNEKRRVFLGEAVDSSQNLNEPIVEVLAESDLENGVLKLLVNDEVVSTRKSNVSRIIGYLLQNPNTLISLEELKSQALGDNNPVSKDNQTKWTERIRTQIQENWLISDDRELAMQILDSSAKGMRLNVQVINSQDNK